MTSSVLMRPLEQRMEALELANRIRCERARVKRELRENPSLVLALVADPPAFLGSMKVEKLLVAVPRMGVVKARRMMVSARISDAKTVGGLSPRQRTELVDLLVAWGRS